MDKYRCMMCGHVYDPAKGEPRGFNTILCNSETMELYECKPGGDSKPYVTAGTDFTTLPDNWRCPTCGYPKSYYRKVEPDTLNSMRTISY
ncbi:MAG TPA: rubredoxin [Methanoregulaceae archaeon]|nr:rubredoxin [Methanoregulaceae archaeon]